MNTMFNAAVTNPTIAPQALAQKVTAAPAGFLGQAVATKQGLDKPSFVKDTFSSSSAVTTPSSTNAVQNLTVASAAALPMVPALGLAASILPLTAALSMQVGQQLIKGVDTFMENGRLSAQRFSRSVAKLNAKATGETLIIPKVQLPAVQASNLSVMA